jgi:hypothetical protein
MDEKQESMEMKLMITPLFEGGEQQAAKDLADDIASHVSNNYRVSITVVYEGGQITKEW